MATRLGLSGFGHQIGLCQAIQYFATSGKVIAAEGGQIKSAGASDKKLCMHPAFQCCEAIPDLGGGDPQTAAGGGHAARVDRSDKRLDCRENIHCQIFLDTEANEIAIIAISVRG
jgi:hypothetical protein